MSNATLNEPLVTENQANQEKPDNEDQPASESSEQRSSSEQDSTEVQSQDANLKADAATSIKGFCMGVCDAVPGVSGGTVALIAGIYERLFVAISHVDTRLFSFLRKKEFKKAANHLDARFLAALVVGLGIGYVVMSFAIKYLMASDSLRTLTLASFAGMVVGSVVLVFGKIESSKNQLVGCLVSGAIGCTLSVVIAFQNTAASTGEVSLIYLFLCTVVAICAMILPGISGAMLLLIFGVYYYVLEIPRNLIHFEDVGSNLVKMSVVLSGCIIGLLTFGRTIKWFLQNHRAFTLSAMLGLMIGSLVVLWPFQHRIEPVIEHRKPTYENFWPEEFGLLAVGAIVCVLFFAAAVVLIDRWANGIARDKIAQPGSAA